MLFVCVFCRNSCAKEELSLLRCGHGFHRSCRTRRKLTCPKCPRKFHYKSVVEKVFLEMDKSDEENKKSSKSEQADLIENVIKNREQYQLEIEERTKKLLAAETKYTQAKGLLKSTMETVKSLTELEREQSVLQSEVADVKKENWRLRRLV
ncbi:hypothetical protein TTRE_0000786601 [Trichuris trichiura]|uniref:RING-type domain-containing protein n=1 Tax=Trichuris trichiura TaxID=36087 RepID=A0A077ZLJ4_TRITR|nr:hypothetical protein TTRE_0000786601 [Trichuris trichiura]